MVLKARETQSRSSEFIRWVIKKKIFRMNHGEHEEHGEQPTGEQIPLKDAEILRVLVFSVFSVFSVVSFS